MPCHFRIQAPVALVLLAAAASPALAAESYDNCTGFIDPLPAVITTQGTWCLRKDLRTAVASGHAITIATNNVTASSCPEERAASCAAT
jgi:hypothetical protein